MIFVSGKRLCGKVDQVPGLFHVATRFLHIYWIPLCPTQTFLIAKNLRLDAKGLPAVADGRAGIRIPRSWKSVAVGYFRGIVYAMLAWLMLLAIFGFVEHQWPIL